VNCPTQTFIAFQNQESAKDYRVEKITRSDCSNLVLQVHYAHRWPSVSYAFGLFVGSSLIGCVTFGTPSSAPLRIGIAGVEYENDVLELNRLVLQNNLKNEASFLVGNAIKLLPRNKIIISFADPSHGHVGIIYQACNFLYTGLSAKRTDWKVKGKENLHGQTIADEFRGVENRSYAMKLKYGEDFYTQPRTRKHRYIYIHGKKTYRKKVLSCLKYKVEKYPTRESAL
jgi:hypothetical protein